MTICLIDIVRDKTNYSMVTDKVKNIMTNDDNWIDDILELDIKSLHASMNRKYRRTRENKLKAIYSNQKRNSKKRGHPAPNYTFKEFKSWAIANDYNLLYDSWKQNNFNKDFAPSGDRLNSSKPYTFDNLQLVTWKENEENYKKESLSKCEENVSFCIKFEVLVIHDWNDDIDSCLRYIRDEINIFPKIIIYKDSDDEWFKLKVNESGLFVAFEPLMPSLVESVYSEETALEYVLKDLVSFI